MSKKFYDTGNAEIIDIVKDVMARHHEELHAHGVTITVLEVGEHDRNGILVPALKHNGYQAAGTIKITSIKERILGISDAILSIDMATWEGFDDNEKAAVIDHELQHLEIVKDKKTGHSMSDDIGRPKLKARLHDWQLGGFRVIAERYGSKSIEVQAVEACRDENGQYYWNWAKCKEIDSGIKRLASANIKDIDETKVSIALNGKESVETTLSGIKKAAKKLAKAN